MPNLQEATQATHQMFQQIVLEGIREPMGMPWFKGILSADEVQLIQAYIVSEAKKTLAGSEE